jgi:sulfate transport system substrate-binding protein
MYSKPVENLKKSWPEAVMGFAFIVVGIVMLWSAALAFGAEPAKALPGARLTLVGASDDKAALAALAKGFRSSAAGRHVSFTQVYGSSRSLSASLGNGRHADLVSLSTPSDVAALADAGVVAPGWDAGAHHGVVADSVVVFVVRKGNPVGLKTWRDLAQPNVEVLFPNPYFASAGKWDVLAAYGSQRELGRSQPAALDFVRELFRNVGVQDPSEAQAWHTFLGGEGDVLLTTEAEAIRAQHSGARIDYVVPNQTLLVEVPVAVTRQSTHPEQAKAFVSWLFTPEAQALLPAQGLRPVLSSAAPKTAFPHPAGLFTIKKVGGWRSAETRFFDQTSGWVTHIEQQLDVSTGS